MTDIQTNGDENTTPATDPNQPAQTDTPTEPTPEQGPDIQEQSNGDATPVGATSDNPEPKAEENTPQPQPVVPDSQVGGLELNNSAPGPVRPPTAQEAVAAARDQAEVTEHFRMIVDPATGAISIVRADWIGDDGLTFHPDYADELRGLI